MDVFVGNSTLVSEFSTRKLEVSGAARLEDQPADPVTLRWADTRTAVQAGGTVGAMVDTMTTLIPAMSDALDAVARNLADTVNALHSTGYSMDGSTGLDFFTGTTAATIKVAITDPEKVAVSSATGALDNSVADAIADVGDSTTGPDRQYQGMIAQLGVSAQASIRRAEIQANVTDQVDASREAHSGVNLDEEMTNLLTYQRGYEAASRVLTTIDSMLDQLINRTGLVGR
jgi:flagellar hook-associated protein 1 FlgK